jgi:hypothetical protein
MLQIGVALRRRGADVRVLSLNPTKHRGDVSLIGAVDADHPPTFVMNWKGEKKKVQGFGRFTTTRGGAYCYLPSIAGLQSLAH